MKKRNRFADAIIIVCVLVGGAVTACLLGEYHRLDAAMPAGVVTALFGFWGGELLIVALRQIFGSDITKSADRTAGEESI